MIVKRDAPLELEVMLIGDTVERNYPQRVTFKTNHPNYEHNTIDFFVRALMITAKQIEKGGEIVIDRTVNCLDAFSIIFPYGGTITTVSLYKANAPQSLRASKPEKRISYMMYENNRMDFSANETGVFLVDYSACHWGNDLKIVVK